MVKRIRQVTETYDPVPTDRLLSPEALKTFKKTFSEVKMKDGKNKIADRYSVENLVKNIAQLYRK